MYTHLDTLVARLAGRVGASDTEGAVTVLSDLVSHLVAKCDKMTLKLESLSYRLESLNFLKDVLRDLNGDMARLMKDRSENPVSEVDALGAAMKAQDATLLELITGMGENERELIKLKAATRSSKSGSSPAGSAVNRCDDSPEDNAADDNGGKPMKQN